VLLSNLFRQYLLFYIEKKERKEKGKRLAAESNTRLPAPEVDDATAPPEPSRLARVVASTAALSFYHFEFHRYTSSYIGIYRAPHLGAFCVYSLLRTFHGFFHAGLRATMGHFYFNFNLYKFFLI
jgi:hypothetical protein